LCVCLYLKGNIDLYLQLLIFTKQAAIYSNIVLKGWQLNGNLPFNIGSSLYKTLCHVQLPVTDISKSLPHSLVNRQADCGTAGHWSVFHQQCCFNKQLSNSTSLLSSLIFRCNNAHSVNTHTEHNWLFPVTTQPLFIHIENITYSPMYQRTLCQYTYRTSLSLACTNAPNVNTHTENNLLSFVPTHTLSIHIENITYSPMYQSTLCQYT